MGLRDLAENQLACKVEAEQAEAQARQRVHVTASIVKCREWFLSVLKTEPNEIICTSSYDGYPEGNMQCRVDVDGMTFGWINNVKRWAEQYHAPAEIPGVRLLEQSPRYMHHPTASESLKWTPVVTSYSYTGCTWATDLPSLAKHLQAVDKVRAKKAARS